MRFSKQSTEESIRSDLELIADTEYVAGSHSKLVETSYRPVWERSSDDTLFQLTETLGVQLGRARPAELRGGTSDSNWFGAAGIPCLDGLGPVGFDDHTPAEKIVLATLFDNALFTAALLKSLANPT